MGNASRHLGAIELLEPRRLLAAGMLDPTFGQGGAIAIPVKTGETVSFIVDAPNGRLLLGANDAAGRLELLRFNADGSPDQTFGAAGKVVTSITDANSLRFSAAGQFAFIDDAGNIELRNADGSIDPSFTSIAVSSLFTLPNDGSHALLAFTPSGKLLVAGSIDVTATQGAPGEATELVELNADGSINHSFAQQGKLEIDSGNLGALVVAKDGSIAVQTTYTNEDTEEDLLFLGLDVQWVSSSGTPGATDTLYSNEDDLEPSIQSFASGFDGTVDLLDQSFGWRDDLHPSFITYRPDGTSQAANYTFTPETFASGVALRATADGKIIFTGPDGYVRRFLSTGEIDPTYGDLGTATVSLGKDAEVITSRIEADGTVVFAGQRKGAFVLARVQGGYATNASVSLDAHGTLHIAGTAGGDRIEAALRHRDGRLIVRSNGAAQSFAIAKVKRIDIAGGDGNDELLLSSGVPVGYLDGGNGDDTIVGSDFADTILGGDGNDSLMGQGGNDRIFGQDGRDILYGGGGNDYLLGGAGKDELHGGNGIDTLSGGGGGDWLNGDAGADVLRGGSGSDAYTPDPLDQIDSVEDPIGGT